MRIVLATQNAGKLRELQTLLQPLGAEIISKAEFSTAEVAETGSSFLENALIKARHATAVSGLPAIADDSGIDVDALHGAPGVLSARFAGPQASDQDNLHKLLQLMQPVPVAQRGAHYRCVLVYMRWPEDPFPIVAQASWHGSIATVPRGQGGFGYDPIFWLPGRQQTAAELSAQEKNTLSHRGQALRALLAALRAAQ